jgi:hypothetical protein
MYGGKIQLIGGSFKEKEEGFKLGLAGFYGEDVDRETGHFSISFQSTGKNEFDEVTADILMRQREGALLLGYRFNKVMLLYLNGFYAHVSSRAKIHINDDRYYVYATTEVYSGSLGIQASTDNDGLNALVSLEGGLSEAHIHSGKKQLMHVFELALGLAW